MKRHILDTTDTPVAQVESENGREVIHHGRNIEIQNNFINEVNGRRREDGNLEVHNYVLSDQLDNNFIREVLNYNPCPGGGKIF